MKSDIRILEVEPGFQENRFRVPLKFGASTSTSCTAFAVRMLVENREGKRGTGWGNMNLSYNWAFPT